VIYSAKGGQILLNACSVLIFVLNLAGSISLSVHS